ncbi:hypothetical protein PhaeoP13_03769 (plasmid) [Phaeobacter piscinae]|uniref:Uncharacterized protein n=1 Tax=Phaeobacter piscinae TaxID=1580596 RepID=A0AAN1GV14_9RHOB|nr:hypothetical protein PhaeoP13_03769 [Phaeobacter piscinae]
MLPGVPYAFALDAGAIDQRVYSLLIQNMISAAGKTRQQQASLRRPLQKLPMELQRFRVVCCRGQSAAERVVPA